MKLKYLIILIHLIFKLLIFNFCSSIIFLNLFNSSFKSLIILDSFILELFEILYELIDWVNELYIKSLIDEKN